MLTDNMAVTVLLLILYKKTVLSQAKPCDAAINLSKQLIISNYYFI